MLLKQGLLLVLVIDFTNQTDLVEHYMSPARLVVMATMATTPWFGGSNPSDDSKL